MAKFNRVILIALTLGIWVLVGIVAIEDDDHSCDVSGSLFVAFEGRSEFYADVSDIEVDCYHY